MLHDCLAGLRFPVSPSPDDVKKGDRANGRQHEDDGEVARPNIEHAVDRETDPISAPFGLEPIQQSAEAEHTEQHEEDCGPRLLGVGDVKRRERHEHGARKREFLPEQSPDKLVRHGNRDDAGDGEGRPMRELAMRKQVDDIERDEMKRRIVR